MLEENYRTSATVAPEKSKERPKRDWEGVVGWVVTLTLLGIILAGLFAGCRVVIAHDAREQAKYEAERDQAVLARMPRELVEARIRAREHARLLYDPCVGPVMRCTTEHVDTRSLDHRWVCLVENACLEPSIRVACIPGEGAVLIHHCEVR